MAVDPGVCNIVRKNQVRKFLSCTTTFWAHVISNVAWSSSLYRCCLQPCFVIPSSNSATVIGLFGSDIAAEDERTNARAAVVKKYFIISPVTGEGFLQLSAVSGLPLMVIR